MNEIRKEKLRIVNLVDAINERGVAILSVELSPIGFPLSVIQWERSKISRNGIEIIHDWRVSSSNQMEDLQKARGDLEQMLSKGSLPVMDVKEEAA